MVNEYAIAIKQSRWINWLSRIGDVKFGTSRVYDYSRAIPGVDYIFSPLSERDSRGYMTAQRRGVKVGDYILLTQDRITSKHRIQALDYYSSPSSMWIALLIKVGK